MTEDQIIGVLIWTIAFWVAGRWIAIKKGRWSNGVGWSLFLFGPIALVIVLFMHKDPDGIAKLRVKEGKRKWCPFCHRDIPVQAVKCGYCGSDLTLKSDTGKSEVEI